MGGDKAKAGGSGSLDVGVSQLLLSPLSPQLSSLTQAHQDTLASLTSKAEGLEKSLSSLETRRAGEAKELAEAQKEAELLRKQLKYVGCGDPKAAQRLVGRAGLQVPR